MYEWDRNFQRCYRYVLFNNFVLAVPKMGQISKSGTFPKCEMVLVLWVFFCHPYIRKKNPGVKLLSAPKMGHRCPKVGHFLNAIFSYIVSRLFCHPCIREKEHKLTENCRK